MMETSSTFEILVNLNHTIWSYNPEDSHLYTCCHENLISSLLNLFCVLMARNVIAKWLALLILIEEVPGSNVGPKTGYPD
jgi:hypothetical protein